MGMVITYVILVMFNVTMKLSNVSKRKNKEIIEYEKNMIICDVGTA